MLKNFFSSSRLNFSTFICELLFNFIVELSLYWIIIFELLSVFISSFNAITSYKNKSFSLVSPFSKKTTLFTLPSILPMNPISSAFKFSK